MGGAHCQSLGINVACERQPRLETTVVLVGAEKAVQVADAWKPGRNLVNSEARGTEEPTGRHMASAAVHPTISEAVKLFFIWMCVDEILRRTIPASHHQLHQGCESAG